MNGTYHPQNAASVEAANPGFIAVAGPYYTERAGPAGLLHTAYLASSLIDQRGLCPHAKEVTHGPAKWIVRKLPMIVDAVEKLTRFNTGLTGIKAGHAVKRYA
jgi:hypothetical protein